MDNLWSIIFRNCHRIFQTFSLFDYSSLANSFSSIETSTEFPHCYSSALSVPTELCSSDFTSIFKLIFSLYKKTLFFSGSPINVINNFEQYLTRSSFFLVLFDYSFAITKSLTPSPYGLYVIIDDTHLHLHPFSGTSQGNFQN